MSLYVIGDTHLSEGIDKPMDIFGGAWTNYRQKLIDGFSALGDDDVTVICGDISWGISLEQALPDFQLIDSFPGKKVLLKGNHDYWWTTVGKMCDFFLKYRLESLSFLHNNCIFYNGVALCGTRGWFTDDAGGKEGKIFKRELIRLEASLQCAKDQGAKAIYAFLHYPPICAGVEIEEITGLLEAYGVLRCFYGHLHGQARSGAFSGPLHGVDYRLISADHIGFKPVLILP